MTQSLKRWRNDYENTENNKCIGSRNLVASHRLRKPASILHRKHLCAGTGYAQLESNQLPNTLAKSENGYYVVEHAIHSQNNEIVNDGYFLMYIDKKT